MPAKTGAWAVFRDDLHRSAGVWRQSPGLPLFTVALLVSQGVLGVILRDADALWIILAGIPFSSFLAGFYGTQRVWYLQSFRGQRMSGGEILPLTVAFIGRFFVLGLLLVLVTIPVFLIIGSSGHGVAWSGIAVSLVMDVVLTFVTPALAFSTRSTMEALRIGVRTIKETLPSSRYYLLAPGLVSTAVMVAWPRSDAGLVAAYAFSLGVAMLALLFKGAVVAFYLRLHPEIPETGAAYLESEWRLPSRGEEPDYWGQDSRERWDPRGDTYL